MSKREQVKEKIGQVAMKCFAKYGLDKTTLDDIAGEMGLNKASLYYYYKNKEDIFLEVAISEGKNFLATLQQKVRAKKGTEARVTFYLLERINYYKNILNMNRVSAETVGKMLPRFFELFDADRQVAQNVFIEAHIALHLGDGGGRGVEIEQHVMALPVFLDAEGEVAQAPVLALFYFATLLGHDAGELVRQRVDLRPGNVLARNKNGFV